MKKLITVLIMVIILIGCFIAYIMLTKPKDGNNAIGEKPEGLEDKPTFTLETCPRIDASLATQPLMSALISDVVEEDVTDDNLEYSNTHPAYEALINGTKDLIIVTEPSEEELALAKEKNVELEVVPIVKEGFVFFVNKNNKVENLTLEQVQKIYSGEIINWYEVGGDDLEIEPYQRPENSGSQTGMLNLVMKDKKLMDPLQKHVVETMKGIVQEVANFDNQMSGIGYSYYYYLTQMYDTIDKEAQGNIKLVSINGVMPSYETIQNGTYPINTAYYIVTLKGDNRKNVEDLVDYMLSNEGQKVAKDEGYVPVK